MTTPPPAPIPAPRKRRTGLIVTLSVLGGFVALCLVIGVIAAVIAGAPDDQATIAVPIDTPSLGSAAATAQPAPGLDTAVRDGQLQFTVTKVQCGVARVGSPDSGQAAQGQYCLVTIAVSNIGDEARTFYAGNQYAYNAAGQRYDADTLAGIYLPSDAGASDDINPGNSAGGVVVFDIPKTATIAQLELHDSAFSGGVRVTVVAAG
jgi:hypothetical protein